MRLTEHRGYVAAFLLGFIVRAVPEAIGYPAPIGYNIVTYYAPAIMYFGANDIMKLFHTPQFSPLVYLLMIPVAQIVHPYTVLAVFSPALHGLLALAAYKFLRTEELTARLALFGSLFVVTQFPVLRLSWDMLSELLGVSIGVLTLVLLAASTHDLRRSLLLSSMLVLAGLAHQIVLLTLLPCVCYKAFKSWRATNVKSAIVPLAASFPSLLLLGWNWKLLQGASEVFPIAKGVKLWFLNTTSYSAGVFPFANYITSFGSYQAILQTVIGFLAFLYIPLLPALAMRRRKSSLMVAWAVILLLMTSSPVLSPSFAFDLWYLWAITLSVPVWLMAFPGFVELLRKARARKGGILLVLLIIAPYAAISVGFMARPPESPFIYFSGSSFRSYSPSSMLSNTVSLKDSLDALKLLTSLNVTMDQNSVLLVHEAFYGFAALSITGEKNIMNYHLGQPTDALPLASQLGFTRVYWIWWLPGYEWHNYRAPLDLFKPVQQSGHLAVFVYEPR
jgi:hypothetical protein